MTIASPLLSATVSVCDKLLSLVIVSCVLFLALHEALKDNLSHSLRDHNPALCIVCNPNSSAGSLSPDHNGYDRYDEGHKGQQVKQLTF